MTKRERVERVYRFERADRIPFVPAIYEQKAALAGVTPSRICRDPHALHTGLMRELAVYDPDMLVVGIDVYNVEAEALGAKVVYFEDSDRVPAIVEPLLRSPADLNRLGIPDPQRDGRMPLYLEVAGALAREVGAEMIVRGAVTGPYSMAAALAGAEPFILATVEEPHAAARLIEFCAAVTVAFGAAFARLGVEPIIFDSRATPALASPRVFHDLVMPVYRDYVLPMLRKAGALWIPLIIGGNTIRILDDLIATGATQLLADAPSPLDRFAEKCLGAKVPFRANVDAVLVNTGSPAVIREQARSILRRCGGQPGFLLGCGVVAYDCQPDSVLAIRDEIDEFAATECGINTVPD